MNQDLLYMLKCLGVYIIAGILLGGFSLRYIYWRHDVDNPDDIAGEYFMAIIFWVFLAMYVVVDVSYIILAWLFYNLRRLLVGR